VEAGICSWRTKSFLLIWLQERESGIFTLSKKKDIILYCTRDDSSHLYLWRGKWEKEPSIGIVPQRSLFETSLRQENKELSVLNPHAPQSEIKTYSKNYCSLQDFKIWEGSQVSRNRSCKLIVVQPPDNNFKERKTYIVISATKFLYPTTQFAILQESEWLQLCKRLGYLPLKLIPI